MIFEWLSAKVRLLSLLGAFLLGMFILIAPWYILLGILVFSLLLDYISFSFQKRSEAE